MPGNSAEGTAENYASLVVLGSGTSLGVPVVGCTCQTCRSEDPRDKRLRPSVLLRLGSKRILIDTSPDFRHQALRFAIDRLDAILYTHEHADHILGLDDVRPFNFMQHSDIPIYASPQAWETIERTFRYVFDERPSESSRPHLTPHVFNDEPLEVIGFRVVPIRVAHGKSSIFGFRCGNLAYLTDHSSIPEESLAKLEGVDILFLDALRTYPHPTHSTVEQSLAIVDRLAPKQAYFTHISHDLKHDLTEQRLPSHVRLAYDGLEVGIDPFVPDSFRA